MRNDMIFYILYYESSATANFFYKWLNNISCVSKSFIQNGFKFMVIIAVDEL